MIGLGCWWVRRRLGAYRDGELLPRRRVRVEAHLTRCAGCRAELRSLERLARWLSPAVAEPAEAVWEAFWPRVRARLQSAPAAPRWREHLLHPALGRPRWALSSAVGVGLVALALLVPWTTERPSVLRLDGPISMAEAMPVQSVETSHPGSSIMVFANQESQLTVIWVFGLDRT